MRFRAQFWKTELCEFFAGGSCSKGKACNYAHGEEDLRIPPDLAKTSLCKEWQVGACKLPAAECQYAHGQEELRRTAVYSKKQVRREALEKHPWQPNGEDLDLGSGYSDTRVGKSQGSRTRNKALDKVVSQEQLPKRDAQSAAMTTVDNHLVMNEIMTSALQSLVQKQDPPSDPAASSLSSPHVLVEVKTPFLEKILVEAMPDYYED
mmetsp:Transcript_28718/g.52860  ORF Transcript_28718/g.52860 Transcript_28718/m.52860 type:complete len:207 (-) Transcript_28718:55-675(-)